MHRFSFVFFVAGLVCHTLAQIDAIARAKNNPQNSRLEILKTRWVTILIRDAWSAALFVLWLQGQLIAVLNSLGVSLPQAATAILDLHVGGAVAWMAGYSFDSLLAFVPSLRSSLPPAIDADSK